MVNWQLKPPNLEKEEDVQRKARGTKMSRLQRKSNSSVAYQCRHQRSIHVQVCGTQNLSHGSVTGVTPGATVTCWSLSWFSISLYHFIDSTKMKYF